MVGFSEDVQGNVRVKGLREFQREIRRISPELAKELRVVNKTVAQTVVDGAVGRAQALGGVQAKAGGSLKARAQAQAAQVVLGGPKYPYAMGAEFGSIRYRQFPSWRGSSASAGYFLYPTIRENSAKIIESYGEAIDRIAAKAFPEGAA